jgi:hypothetical protein
MHDDSFLDGMLGVLFGLSKTLDTLAAENNKQEN